MKHFTFKETGYIAGGEFVGAAFQMKSQSSVDNRRLGPVLPPPRPKRETLMNTAQMTKVWGRSR